MSCNGSEIVKENKVVSEKLGQYNSKKTVALCRRCPRRWDSDGIVNHSVVIGVDTVFEGQRAHVKEVRQFTNVEPGQKRGFTDDMPVNSTLDDIDQCVTPVVIRREGFFGLRKVRECGAVICALERYQDDLGQAQNSDD